MPPHHVQIVAVKKFVAMPVLPTLRALCTREQFKRYRCTGQKARAGYGNGGNRTQGANHSGGKKSAACPLAEAGGPGFPHAGAGRRPTHATGPPHRRGIRREPAGVPKFPGGMVAPAALRLADWTPRTANATGPGRRSTVQGATRATPRPVKRLAGHPGRFSVGRLSRGVAVMGRNQISDKGKQPERRETKQKAGLR